MTGMITDRRLLISDRFRLPWRFHRLRAALAGAL